MTTCTSTFSEMSAAVLYAIVRLRINVFVVEQQCPYEELDGRDIEDSALHVWTRDGDDIVGYLRVLPEPPGYRIGRVCTEPRHRGKGLAAAMLSAALRHTGDAPVRLHAQTAAVRLYQRHGFTMDGPQFLEDGIPHVPMLRTSS
jgi:ElaA protein